MMNLQAPSTGECQFFDAPYEDDIENADFSYRDDYLDFLLGKRTHPVGASIDGVSSAEARRRADGSKHMFGNPVFEDAYRILSDALKQDDVCCLYRVEESQDSKIVYLCNTWKIERSNGNVNVRSSFRDRSIFYDDAQLLDVPRVKLVPPSPQRMLGQSLVAEAVQIYVESYVGNSLAEHEILCEARTSEKFCVVENALVEGTVRRLLKRLGAERTASLSETTSKVIWKVLVDNEFFSTVAYAHFLEPVFLSDYVKFAQEESLYSAIAKVDKRMLVLHDFIAPHEFTSSLTFSTKRWVQDGLAKAGMPVSDRARLSGGAAVRALRQLHPAMLRYWASRTKWSGFTILFEIIAQLSDEPKIPQRVMWRLLKALSGRAIRRHVGNEDLGTLTRLIRLYVRHICAEGARGPSPKYKQVLDTNPLESLLDWWLAVGRQADMPAKQSTFNSVLRRSDDWHNLTQRGGNPLRSWNSAIMEARAGSVTALALNTTELLEKEGRELHHCVGSYAEDCNDGFIRIFSLIDENKTRSTLALLEQAGSWIVSQNLGLCNAKPNAALLAAGRAVAAQYNGCTGPTLDS